MHIVAIGLWDDEREALTSMRTAGRFRSDEDVLRSALSLLAETMDAQIPATNETFQLGRAPSTRKATDQLPLFDGGLD